jgi:hypothetical protein
VGSEQGLREGFNIESGQRAPAIVFVAREWDAVITRKEAILAQKNSAHFRAPVPGKAPAVPKSITRSGLIKREWRRTY